MEIVLEDEAASLNPLSPAALMRLERRRTQAVAEAEEAKEQGGHVLLLGNVSSGRRPCFSAGADISALHDASSQAARGGQNNAASDLAALCDRIEKQPVATVACVDGVCMGGGLELAMAAHVRIASSRAVFALPECRQLGILPGAGGTQRLPRLVPLRDAVQLIAGKGVGLTGPVQWSARKAKASGLVDEVVQVDASADVAEVADALRTAAHTYMHRRGRSDTPLVPTRYRPVCTRGMFPTGADGPITLKQMLAVCESAKLRGPTRQMGGEAVHCALDSVAAACRSSKSTSSSFSSSSAERSAMDAAFDAGLAEEGRLFRHLLCDSSQSRALRYLFLSARVAAKYNRRASNRRAAPELPDMSPDAVLHIGVVGAGTMGTGIALAALMGGNRVTICDASEATLQKSTQFAERTIDKAAKAGLIKPSMRKLALAMLQTSNSLEEFAGGCDVVIEAVYENMALKKQIFGVLARTTQPHAVLATNTSSLDVDEIAQAVPAARRGQVIGMHFFSPAHAMPLLEIVRGRETHPDTINFVLKLGKKMRKTVVVVGNCHGFVANRLVFRELAEALFLLEEGMSVERMDKVVKDFGFPIGLCAMQDIAGHDVARKIRDEQGLTDPAQRPRNVRYSTLGDKMYLAGRYGQKVGRGWYRYEPRSRYTPLSDPAVADLIARHREEEGIHAISPQPSRMQVLERLFFPVINEGFRVLQEQICARASDIDVIFTSGFSWPSWRGGPMFTACHDWGLSTVRERLQQLATEHPNSPHFVPCSMLRAAADADASIDDLSDLDFLHGLRAQSRL